MTEADALTRSKKKSSDCSIRKYKACDIRHIQPCPKPLTIPLCPAGSLTRSFVALIG